MGKTVIPNGGPNDRAVLQGLYLFPGVVGNLFYVSSSTGSPSGPGFTPENAYATLAQAVSAATASNGDVIVLLPGHTESIGASGIALSKAGLTIIGMGVGANRPTFTWTATDSVLTISAANVLLQNIRCTVSIDEVVSMILVSGVNVKLDAVDFFETASAQAIQFLLTTAAADDLEICNCRHYQVNAAAATQAWIGLVGADRAYIHDNTFILALKDNASSGVIVQSTTACLNIEIARNKIKLTGYSAALVSAFKSANTTTGLVVDNRIGTDVAANTTINDMAGCYSFNNLCTNAADTSGIVDPVVDT